MENIINKFKINKNINKKLMYYTSIEAPKGEMGCLGCHNNRIKIRTPGFFNLQSYNYISKNLLLSDSLAILGSLDIVLGEVDR